jgi:hypothetical protein
MMSSAQRWARDGERGRQSKVVEAYSRSDCRRTEEFDAASDTDGVGMLVFVFDGDVGSSKADGEPGFFRLDSDAGFSGLDGDEALRR